MLDLPFPLLADPDRSVAIEPLGLADPKDPEHRELLDWHGGPFDRTDIDEPAIKWRMAPLAKARGRKKR